MCNDECCATSAEPIQAKTRRERSKSAQRSRFTKIKFLQYAKRRHCENVIKSTLLENTRRDTHNIKHFFQTGNIKSIFSLFIFSKNFLIRKESHSAEKGALSSPKLFQAENIYVCEGDIL